MHDQSMCLQLMRNLFVDRLEQKEIEIAVRMRSAKLVAVVEKQRLDQPGHRE